MCQQCRVGRVVFNSFFPFVTFKSYRFFFFFVGSLTDSNIRFLLANSSQKQWFSKCAKTTCFLKHTYLNLGLGFPGGTSGKKKKKKNHLQCRRHGFQSLVRERSGEGIGNPLQYPCLENFMDRGASQAIVHGIAKSWTYGAHKHTP